MTERKKGKENERGFKWAKSRISPLRLRFLNMIFGRLAANKAKYRIMPNKRTPPDKRPPFFFMIAYYKELKEKSEVIKEIKAKKQ